MLLNRSAIHNQPAFGCQRDFLFFWLSLSLQVTLLSLSGYLIFNFTFRLPHFHFKATSLSPSGYLSFTFSFRLPHFLFHFQATSLSLSGYLTFTFRLPHILCRAGQSGRPQNIQGSQGSQDCIHHARWSPHSTSIMPGETLIQHIQCSTFELRERLLKAIVQWRSLANNYSYVCPESSRKIWPLVFC